jgi:pseudouridine-5'-phosphate glycosidase
MNQLPFAYRLSPEVGRALGSNAPVVALETTVITHGLPEPENLKLARDMEAVVRKNGATPATVGVLNGHIWVGMSGEQVQDLANSNPLYKISRRDFGFVIARKESGGTTVAGTLIAAHTAGIRVLATGGIGGVHRGAPFDVSADLHELSRRPLIVVCAGAKSILDIPATLEVLETLGVPVIGYQTDDFPAFYARSSGIKVQMRAENPREVAEIAAAHWKLGLESAVVVVAPVPKDKALPIQEMESAITQALAEAAEQKIHGKDATPFLLARVSTLTGRASLQANLALLRNNAKIAAKIAGEYHRPLKTATA